jgi:hypothetical protein
MNTATLTAVRTTENALMSALQRGLPITLLADLVDPDGPRSHEIYRREMTTPVAAVLTIPEAARAYSAR